jgi:hypothetical protein
MEVDHDMLWDPEKKVQMRPFVQSIYDRLNDKLAIENGSFSIAID